MSVNLTIDNIPVTVEDGTTILNAAKKVGVEIPTLCYLQDRNKPAACRMCMVDVNGRLSPSCVTPVWEGMDVKTNTNNLRDIRRTILELTLANHNCDCTICKKSGNCKLQSLANTYSVGVNPFDTYYDEEIDDSACLVRDLSKCIKCGRCISVCKDITGVKALSYMNRSGKTIVSTQFNEPLKNTSCIECGQCINVCPVGALTVNEDISNVYDALDERTYYNVCLMSSKASENLSKEFGRAENKVIDIITKAGFEKVYDYEDYLSKEIDSIASILKENMKEEKPLIYTCTSALKNELLKNLPSESMDNFLNLDKVRKDANEDFKENLISDEENKDVHLTKVDNCISYVKDNENVDGIDLSLSMKGLADFVKSTSIDFASAKVASYDKLDYSATFNPYELAIQTGYNIYRLNDDSKVEKVYGNVKEYTVKLDDNKLIKCAVVSGFKDSLSLIKSLLNNEIKYDILFCVSCNNGCQNGGGKIV